MGRKRKCCQVGSLPAAKGFRPFGPGLEATGETLLNLDEYESLRLLDYQHLTQEEAAVKMQVSRPTLTRIYEKARGKIARALVEGHTLMLEGGEVELSGADYRCRSCHDRFNQPDDQRCPKCHSAQITPLEQCFTRSCRQCRLCRGV